jgi:hypothetical protein
LKNHNDDDDIIPIKLRIPKSLLKEIDEAAYCFGEISRNTAINRVLQMDFMGQLSLYSRIAAHAKAQAANQELAQTLQNIAKPLRKIVRESVR